MSEMAKQARSDMRAKIKRLTTTDPHQKVDSSDWSPSEPLNAGQKIYDKAKQKSATVKVYKYGGKVQSDRGPIRRDRKARGGNADGGVPTSRFNIEPVQKSALLAAGGRAGRASGGRTGCEHMAKGGSLRTGNYTGGTRPTGGRIARAKGGKAFDPERTDMEQEMEDQARGVPTRRSRAMTAAYMEKFKPKKGEEREERARGGRTKGKTNIHINIGQQHPQGQPMPIMPPPSQVTRPPMPAPMAPPPGGAPPGGPPGAPGGPPMMPPSMAGGPPPQMPRARGGRTGNLRAGIDTHMRAGAGGGLGRLEKTKIQARENHHR